MQAESLVWNRVKKKYRYNLKTQKLTVIQITDSALLCVTISRDSFFSVDYTNYSVVKLAQYLGLQLSTFATIKINN